MDEIHHFVEVNGTGNNDVLLSMECNELDGIYFYISAQNLLRMLLFKF